MKINQVLINKNILFFNRYKKSFRKNRSLNDPRGTRTLDLRRDRAAF